MAVTFTITQLDEVLAAIERGVAKLAASEMLRKGALEQTGWTLTQVRERVLRLPSEENSSGNS